MGGWVKCDLRKLWVTCKFQERNPYLSGNSSFQNLIIWVRLAYLRAPAHYTYGAAANHATGSVGFPAVSKLKPILRTAFLTKPKKHHTAHMPLCTSYRRMRGSGGAAPFFLNLVGARWNVNCLTPCPL